MPYYGNPIKYITVAMKEIHHKPVNSIIAFEHGDIHYFQHPYIVDGSLKIITK